MSIAPKGMVSAADYALIKNVTPDEVVAKLRTGDLIGRIVENDWFVERAEIDKTSQPDDSINGVTAIMLAAANIYWREILSVIDSRRAIPIKAATPEFGLRVDQIHSEAKQARKRALYFDIVIGIVAIIGLSVLFPASYNSDEYGEYVLPWTSIIVTLLLVALADHLSRRAGLIRVREIIKSLDNTNAKGKSTNDPRNVSVSGGYSPFVGAGSDIGGWSFTVNLDEPERIGDVVTPTTAEELYAETSAALDRLEIPNLIVRDEAFVHGRDIRGLQELMPEGPFSQPSDTISAQVMVQLIGRNEPILRHYKTIRLELWDGQLILSNFLRYSIVSGTLFVENRAFVLLPLLDKYSDLQNLPLVSTPGDLIRDFVASLFRAPFIWMPVLFAAFNYIQGGFLHSEKRWYKSNRKEVERNRKYNYGWITSLREVWSGKEYSRYFQLIDKDFYGKLVKETLLDSLFKSLDKRNISTAGFKDASTRIYNEGVIVNGGTLQAESIAAGSGARASVKKAWRAATKPED